jgi:hypothetical protein
MHGNSAVRNKESILQGYSLLQVEVEWHNDITKWQATLDGYHHFHGHSGMCAWLAS